MAPQKDKILKLPTIQRLPNYLHIAKTLKDNGEENVSTTYLANKIGLDSIVVRKDLAVTGVNGRPGVGYNSENLIDAIESFLGWDKISDAFVIGTGCLGSALLGHNGFAAHGLNVIAGFDNDPNKINTEVAGKKIFQMEKLADLTVRMRVKLGILCVPAEHAQETTDKMIDAGITGIWNFTPVNIEVPENVITHQQDLASGLAVLSLKLSKKMTRV